MPKRTSNAHDGDDAADGPVKRGVRPSGHSQDHDHDMMDVDDAQTRDMGEFEDEFEDEYESDDEILEAGVDGRPDAEREAEEKGK